MPHRAALRLLPIGLTVAALLAAAPAAGEPPPKQPFDARQGRSAVEAGMLRDRSARLAVGSELRRFRRSLGPQAIVDVDPLTRTPRHLARLDELLTGPSRDPAPEIALRYVRRHPEVFRLSDADLATLRLRRDYVDIEGTHHLSWLQYADGLALFGNGLQANVTRDGRLINVLGSPVPGLQAPAAAPSALSGNAAIREARRDLGETRHGPGADDSAAAVLFETPGGTRRAWRVLSLSAARPAVHVIDAESGRVLLRQTLTSDAHGSATGLAFDYFPGAPRGGRQRTVDFTRPGWLPASANALNGNNAHAFTDLNANQAADPGEDVGPRRGRAWDYQLVPVEPDQACGRPIVCTWDPDVPFGWRANLGQSATQAFTFANRFHDHLAAAPVGFTEAAGNLQQVNHTGQGVGGDAAAIATHFGADRAGDGIPAFVNDGFAWSGPDGEPAGMGLLLTGTPGLSYPDEDPFLPGSAADAADLVYHEYAHLLTSRLLVDAAGVRAFGSIQAAVMNEGWSDWYALEHLVSRGLIRDGRRSGEIVDWASSGAAVPTIRTQPIDCPVGGPAAACPGAGTAGPGGYTYGDLLKISSTSTHFNSEIWSETLWDLREAVGSRRALSLVTRALELSPPHPSFLDQRNAILQADIVVFDGRLRDAIWRVFARRGMGFFAGIVDANDFEPVEDFSRPPRPGSPVGTLAGRVVDHVTGRPLSGAAVYFGGHNSGFAGDYADVTDAAGRYRIDGIHPGTYPHIRVAAPGHRPVDLTLTVRAGSNGHDFAVTRNYAAASGGARVAAFDGPDYGVYGCGPGGAIDQSAQTGWGSDSDLVDCAPGPATPKSITIELPEPVDVSGFAIDPTATCGDDVKASTGGYRIETSADGTAFTPAAGGRFGPGDLRRANAVAATAAGVRFVRFTMLDPQVGEHGVSCASSTASGCRFLDMTEIEVFGARSAGP